MVSVAVENSGNVRLKPLVSFVLLDVTGTEVGHASVQMDTFYARTSTFIEVPLAAALPPGTYSVRVTVEDSIHGLQAASSVIPLVVEAAPEASAAASPVPGKIDLTPPASPASPLAVGLGILIASGVGIGLVWRSRRVQHQPT